MRIIASVLIALATIGCGREPQPNPSAEREVDVRDAALPVVSAPSASATIEPRGGSDVRGTARLADTGSGVRVVVQVTGLEPAGDYMHGLQILAAADCDEVDENTPHFDPDGAPHGPFDASRGARHAGDLGNIRAYDGAGRYDRLDALLDLEGSRSVVGRALVVRAEADDAWSVDGSAGEIVACGVLQPPGATPANDD